MANTSDQRRRTRAEALEHVFLAVNQASNKGQGWKTEFDSAMRAISRVLENQDRIGRATHHAIAHVAEDERRNGHDNDEH